MLQSIINEEKRVFIFLGEAGSGKSEIAINLALKLTASGKKIRFFDMDQTKPMFRSRDLTKMLTENQITVDYSKQLLDTPTIPSGVLDKIKEPGVLSILDVGGNVTGAVTIGQFADSWGIDTASYIVVNPYRMFSGNQNNVENTINNIATAARLKDFKLIFNPNFGQQTILQEVIEGYRYLEESFKCTDYKVYFLTVLDKFENEIKCTLPGVHVLGIKRYIKASWEKDDDY